MLKSLARRIGRTNFANDAIAEGADLAAFQERPRPRLLAGLILLTLSFVLGWPLVAAFGIAAIWAGNPYLAIIGGPAAYLFSWGLWAVAMWLTANESYDYGRLFLRWAVRAFVERHGVDSSSE
jgi:hypothetical protein